MPSPVTTTVSAKPARTATTVRTTASLARLRVRSVAMASARPATARTGPIVPLTATADWVANHRDVLVAGSTMVTTRMAAETRVAHRVASNAPRILSPAAASAAATPSVRVPKTASPARSTAERLHSAAMAPAIRVKTSARVPPIAVRRRSMRLGFAATAVTTTATAPQTVRTRQTAAPIHPATSVCRRTHPAHSTTSVARVTARATVAAGSLNKRQGLVRP